MSKGPAPVLYRELHAKEQVIILMITKNSYQTMKKVYRDPSGRLLFSDRALPWLAKENKLDLLRAMPAPCKRRDR